MAVGRVNATKQIEQAATRGSLLVANTATGSYIHVAPTTSGQVLRYNGTDSVFATVSDSEETQSGLLAGTTVTLVANPTSVKSVFINGMRAPASEWTYAAPTITFTSYVLGISTGGTGGDQVTAVY